MTPLHWASSRSLPYHTSQLLSHGADITTQDIDGNTCLHWAAQVRQNVISLLKYAWTNKDSHKKLKVTFMFTRKSPSYC